MYKKTPREEAYNSIIAHFGRFVKFYRGAGYGALALRSKICESEVRWV